MRPSTDSFVGLELGPYLIEEYVGEVRSVAADLRGLGTRGEAGVHVEGRPESGEGPLREHDVGKGTHGRAHLLQRNDGSREEQLWDQRKWDEASGLILAPHTG